MLDGATLLKDQRRHLLIKKGLSKVKIPEADLYDFTMLLSEVIESGSLNFITLSSEFKEYLAAWVERSLDYLEECGELAWVVSDESDE